MQQSVLPPTTCLASTWSVNHKKKPSVRGLFLLQLHFFHEREVMSKILMAAISAVLVLSACGGGSSAPAAATPTAVTPATVTGVVTPTTSGTPPATTGAATLTGSVISIAGGNGVYIFKPNVGATVSVAGNGNIIQIADGSSLGVTSLAGNDNHVIIGKSVSATSFAVSGINNTIWIPEGTTLTVSNTMAGSNKVKYYKP